MAMCVCVCGGDVLCGVVDVTAQQCRCVLGRCPVVGRECCMSVVENVVIYIPQPGLDWSCWS